MTKTTPHPIIVIGSINTDMVIQTDALPRAGQTVLGNNFRVNAGGKGANQAVAAARLGGKTKMVGNLGTDNFGDLAISRLKLEGVECSFIGRDEKSASGVALISVDSQGENTIVVAPGANHTLNEQQITRALSGLNQNTLVLLQLEIPLNCVGLTIEIAKSANSRVILDPAPAQPLPTELLRGLFLVTPNETEAEVLTGVAINTFEDAKRAANKFLNFGVLNVVITLGKQGALLVNKDQCDILKAPTVQAVDTTAAGDCFNGALAAALARNASLFDAALYAIKAASLSVMRQGAQDSLPTETELS